MDYNITIAGDIDSKHQDCLWYGGWLATIEYDKWKFYIEAVGDVYCELYDEQGKEIEDVRDKYNNGRFYNQMSPYIKNDEELHNLISENRLVFENNNWLEVFIVAPDGKNIDLDLSGLLDSSSINEAIEEVIAVYIEDTSMSNWLKEEWVRLKSEKENEYEY